MPLTTTSYAILGLLDLQDWTAYELTQQARRSLAFVWPMSESQLYAEPKRLARDGLVTIRETAAGPQRTRQLLHITAAGRRELRDWLATEPLGPRLQMEVLVRTLFATAGTRDELLGSLRATRASAQAAYERGLELVGALRSGDNPYPERLPTNVLWMVFVHDLLLLTLDWVDLAEGEVEGWPDLGGGDPERTRALLDAMVRAHPVVRARAAG